VAGREVDPEELRAVTVRAREGARLWGECLAMSALSAL